MRLGGYATIESCDAAASAVAVSDRINAVEVNNRPLQNVRRSTEGESLLRAGFMEVAPFASSWVDIEHGTTRGAMHVPEKLREFGLKSRF